MKEHKYDFSLLSSHRGEIMGFAMLWIMLFHCSGDFRDVPVFGLIKYYGSIGVDMFLVLSGIGLYYSAEKLAKGRNSSWWVLSFYRKRLLRIIPATVICLAPWYLYLGGGRIVSLGRFLLDVTSLSFWADGQNRGWYAALSLLLYLVYPLIYTVISSCMKKERPGTWLFVSFLLIAGLEIAANVWICKVYPDTFAYLDIALCRIPVFTAGCFLAAGVKSKRETSALLPLLCAAAAVLCVLVLEKYGEALAPFGVRRYLYGIAGLCMCIVLSFLFGKIRLKCVLSLFSFAGKYTLELYLTHTQYLSVFLDLAYARFGENFSVTMACNAAAVLAAFMTAVALHKLLKRAGL